MTATPFDWNVVVVGAWNPAILTPAGVSNLLFELPPDTPVEVQVSMEHRIPIRTIYDGISVSSGGGRLVIVPSTPNEQSIIKCGRLATRALNVLSRTPISASGVNIRFHLDPLPVNFVDLLESSLDRVLSDAGQTIRSRFLKRSIAWKNGDLNLEVSEADGNAGQVLFNYHLQSTTTAANIAWLESIEEMVEHSNELAWKIGMDFERDE